MQHFLTVTPVISGAGVRAGGQGTPCRATCTGFHVLGTVCSDAVLPFGEGPIAAGDLRRAGRQRRETAPLGSWGSAQAVDAELCQRASALRGLPQPLRATAGAVPAGRGATEEIPVLE